MAVTTTTNKVIYTGDGVTTTFAIPYQLPVGSNGSDIQCTVVDNKGNPTLLPGNFSVSVPLAKVTYPMTAGVAPLPAGAAALPANWQIVIARVETITQPTSLTTQGPFNAATIMAMFDFLTMICQQIQEQLNRASLVAINQPSPGVSPVAPTAAGLVLIIGTFAQLQAQVALNPTVPCLGKATDQGNDGQLLYYCGNVNAPGSTQGWYGPLAGG